MDSESDDNESTLDVEEANGTKGSVEEELDELNKEQDMDMDELLTSVCFFYLFTHLWSGKIPSFAFFLSFYLYFVPPN